MYLGTNDEAVTSHRQWFIVADTSAVLRGCLDLSIAAFCWETTLFSAQSHLEMASYSWEDQTLSVHRKPPRPNFWACFIFAIRVRRAQMISGITCYGGNKYQMLLKLSCQKCAVRCECVKPQLFPWILVLLSSALHVCAGSAFSLNPLRTFSRNLAVHCFLHLCCRHITAAKFVIAVRVFLLWPSAVH